MVEYKTLHSVAGQVNVAIVNPRNQQNKYWKRGAFYERKMLEYIWRNYRGGTFIDCGGCIGNHTLFFAAFCADKVLTVEPDRGNYEHIIRNVNLNNLQDKVIVINSAVSNFSGTGALERFGKGEGQQRLVAGSGIDVLTIDEIVKEYSLSNVSLVKLDVEYSEMQAMEGAIELLKAQSPVLFVERNSEQEQAAAVNFLAKFGYTRKHTFNASPTLEFVKDNNG